MSDEVRSGLGAGSDPPPIPGDPLGGPGSTRDSGRALVGSVGGGLEGRDMDPDSVVDIVDVRVERSGPTVCPAFQYPVSFETREGVGGDGRHRTGFRPLGPYPHPPQRGRLRAGGECQ